jgi:hypothetical protein
LLRDLALHRAGLDEGPVNGQARIHCFDSDRHQLDVCS